MALVLPACAGEGDADRPGSDPDGAPGEDPVAPSGRYTLQASETYSTPCPPFQSTADLTFDLSGSPDALAISSPDPDVGSLDARVASGEIPELEGSAFEAPVLAVSAVIAWDSTDGVTAAVHASVSYLLDVAASGEVVGLATSSFYWDELDGGTRCDYEWDISGQWVVP